jgi:hypothetical protein
MFSMMKRQMEKWELKPRIMAKMVKGALPPTIAIAIYQIPAVASLYGNFGFLVAVASILSLHLLPRARFVQNVAIATVCSTTSSLTILRTDLSIIT